MSTNFEGLRDDFSDFYEIFCRNGPAILLFDNCFVLVVLYNRY